MGQIIYNITAGVPDFYASILPEEAPMQTHASTGLYSFDNIPDGIYSLTVVDSVGCEQVFNNIEIINLPINYGALYNWYAATDVRGISSSDDWVVPSKIIFENLLNYIDTYDSGSETWPLAGGKLKETGFEHWLEPNEGATDEYGFNAVGGGVRDAGDGNFYIFKEEIYIQSATDDGIGNSYYISFGTNETSVYLSTAGGHRDGFSIRLCNPSTALSEGATGTYTQNDGKIIPTIVIGGVEWTMNLNETKYRNGDWISGYDGGVYTPITNAAWAALTTEAMCYYNDDENNG